MVKLVWYVSPSPGCPFSWGHCGLDRVAPPPPPLLLSTPLIFCRPGVLTDIWMGSWWRPPFPSICRFLPLQWHLARHKILMRLLGLSFRHLFSLGWVFDLSFSSFFPNQSAPMIQMIKGMALSFFLTSPAITVSSAWFTIEPGRHPLLNSKMLLARHQGGSDNYCNYI